MKRRSFLALAGATAVAVHLPGTARAQQVSKIPRIAYIYTTTPTTTVHDGLIQGLADVGLVDGKNIAIDYYIAPNDAAVPEYVARAVASKPDLIVALSSPANVALKALGTTIPVVFTIVQDPVAIRLVDSYNRPGGNMTGTMTSAPDLLGKQLEILREIVPSMKRVAFFGQPDDPPYKLTLMQVQAAARSLGLDLMVFEIREGEGFDAPFDEAARRGAQAVHLMRVTYFSNNTPWIASAALRNRLPTMGAPNHAEMGVLVGYGSNTVRVAHDAGEYIAAILKGAKPADMAIGQPTAFDLVVNQKTASALGITFPPSVLLRATAVIS